MGIKKLTKYIKDNFHEWEDVRLEDCPVVMDGNGLGYYLYKSKKADLEWKFGGQYNEFNVLLRRFFDALREKNVQPVHIVFDGVDPVDKLKTLEGRREGTLQKIIKSIDGTKEPDVDQPILPPLNGEIVRTFLHDYNSAHGNLKIYCGDEEADSLGVVIANMNNCPLLDGDSDYFIANLQRGYIPYDKLSWTVPGEPIEGKMYRRDTFARSLGIDRDMVIAIPAIVGNDSIPNLVEMSLAYRIRAPDSVRYGGKDTEKGINYIRRQRSIKALESNLLSRDGMEVLRRFKDNLRKAREMYEGDRPFNEREFRRTCSYKTENGDQFPSWMIGQYRENKLTKYFFEALLKGEYFLLVPDDYQQESCKVFSRPIRKEMFSILEMQRTSVREVVREGRELVIQEVRPIRSDLSIYGMDTVSADVRVSKLCSVLKCDPSTLTDVDQNWYIVVASVCYWGKTARISRNDLKLKALLLCFAECYHKEPTQFQPVFNVRTLHTLTQWQCVYQDAIFLNQILALPLPYVSPADIFDGKRVSYYCQQNERFLKERLSSVGRDIRGLYDKLLGTISKN